MKDDDIDDIDDDPLNPNSMVLIHDSNEYSIFPPNKHENLQIFSDHYHSIPESSSSPSSPSSFSSFSPTDSDSLSPFNYHLRSGSDFVAWMSLGIHILRSKFYGILLSFRNSSSQRRVVSSIGVPVGVLIMLCWVVIRLWYWVRKWRKKRNLKKNQIRLINIIKEKDEMIAKLLHQIAQMNEILIARHKALAAKVVD